MKTIAIAAATILAAFASGASAQTYYERPSYDRLSGDQECFNPRAGHFERVRPGETQNDLDLRRCHFVGYAVPDRGEGRDRREVREMRQECWNPRARHYEEVRRGESQDDLDFDRCRTIRG